MEVTFDTNSNYPEGTIAILVVEGGKIEIGRDLGTEWESALGDWRADCSLRVIATVSLESFESQVRAHFKLPVPAVGQDVVTETTHHPDLSEIAVAVRDGMSKREAARKFGVSRHVVDRACRV